jgi:hypothetical protein
MMTDVNTQPPVTAEQKPAGTSDKELNFRKLEAAREAEKEARIRSEMREEQLRKELQDIRAMLQPPEKDPLDDADEYVDAAKLRAKLAKERAAYQKEAQEIAEKTYRQQRELEDKKNFLGRLKSEFHDFDQVMSDENLENLQKIDPFFIETAMALPDDYAKRKMTYQKIKHMEANKPKAEPAPTIQDKVAENAQNPFYIAPSVATPSAVDFDVKSPIAREQAYAKLKAAQRRPIGN